MTIPSHTLRASLLACAFAILPLSWTGAAEPIRIVFQNGRSIAISAVTLQADKLVITESADGFTTGQAFPLTSADHVFGEKPSAINPAIALLLTEKPAEALKLLEPVIAEQRLTAKIPGNFWLEPARAALVAYALTGNTAKCTEIGKEISDATPAQGIDPFVTLGKALLLPGSTKVAERAEALGDSTTDNLPAEVCAYASFFRGQLLKGVKRNPDAAEARKQDAEILESFLMVPCLYPSGGMILNAVAEMNSAEILVALGRREEAVALLNSSIHNPPAPRRWLMPTSVLKASNNPSILILTKPPRTNRPMKHTFQKAIYAALFLFPMTVFGAEAAAGSVQKKTLIDTYLEGGWVMHILLLFSIGMVWLIIDIWMRTNSKKMTPEEDLAIVREAFLAGDYVGAYQAMKASFSPFAEVMRAGLGSVGYGKDATEEALYATVEKISSTLQTRINYLSVIGVCAPMIGLLGTVGGMKGAFGSLGTTGLSGGVGELAGHIGEVLVATATGLLVAIPAFMAFYFLRNKLQGAVHHLHESAEHLFRNAPYDYLKDADVGQEETYAALPNWVQAPEG